MSSREPPSSALAPRAAADLAARRDPPQALVRDGALVHRGSALPRSRVLSVGTGLLGATAVNVGVYAAALGFVSEAAMWGTFGGVLGAIALAAGSRAWRRWRKGRQMDVAPLLSGSGEARGQQVQVRGTVERPAGLLRTPKGRSAVLVRYHGSKGREGGPGAFSAWRWELHATDFCVRGADGREVWVDTRSILLLPHPPPVDSRSLSDLRPLHVHIGQEEGAPISWIYDEEIIAPGERVQVVGRLDLESHPDGSAGSDRQPRLRPVLRGTPGEPVLVRRYVPSDPETP
jgi:hypothetical protein